MSSLVQIAKLPELFGMIRWTPTSRVRARVGANFPSISKAEIGSRGRTA
jgi:hypothetical protein